MPYPGPAAYFAPGDTQRRLGWERNLAWDILSPIFLMNPRSGLVGNSADRKRSATGYPVVERRVEQFKQGGVTSRVTLVRAFKRAPVMGNATLREREEGVHSQTFDWNINLLRHAGKTDGEIVDQMIPWEQSEVIRNNHREYWPIILEAGALMHACGFTINRNDAVEWWHQGADLELTLCNAPVAPDSNHIIRAGGVATDDLVGTNPTAVLDVDTIDQMVSRADQLPIPIKETSVAGRAVRGVLILHNNQVETLRKRNSTWYAMVQNAIKGGYFEKNPLLSGKFDRVFGMYNNVVLAMSRYIPPGVNAAGTAVVANTRRAVLLGGQALTLGLGKQYANENTFKIASDNWDYGDKIGIAIRCLLGVSKTRFRVEETNQVEDFGTLVCTSYAKDQTINVAA